MRIISFEDLEAWRLARHVVADVYALTRTPGIDKDFGLRAQLQRAAVSIMTNIAEGFERSYLQEKLQFYNVARASTGEVRSLLYVAEDNYSRLVQYIEPLRDDVIRAGKMIYRAHQVHPTKKTKQNVIALRSPNSHLPSMFQSANQNEIILEPGRTEKNYWRMGTGDRRREMGS